MKASLAHWEVLKPKNIRFAADPVSRNTEKKIQIIQIVKSTEYRNAVEFCHETIIGEIWHGQSNPDEVLWPSVTSGLQPLDGQGWVEIFHAQRPAQSFCEDSLHFSYDESTLFCYAKASSNIPTADASRELYDRLIKQLGKTGHAHFLRIWNVVPDILIHEDGMERYRQFCIGRHDALLKHIVQSDLPAASAVGSPTGKLKSWFIAARKQGIQIENPRQVSAYCYPGQYGLRSPSFARATLCEKNNHVELYISGTASIVGHQSMHLDDVIAQTWETIRNIEAVMNEANRKHQLSFSLDKDTCYFKVYLPNVENYEAVKNVVSEWIGNGISIIYLRADLCRRELLCEIEGIVWVNN